MNKELRYRKGARVIVETCMGIKPNERVFIITSRGFTKNADLLAEEAEALGAEVTIVKVDVKQIQIEPPEEVSKKMLESDVILGVLPYDTIQLFLHMDARRAATDVGARVGGVPYIKPDISHEDIFKITELTEKLAKILTNGDEVRITTKKGTDVTLSIRDRISAPLRVRHVVPGAWGAVRPDRRFSCDGARCAGPARPPRPGGPSRRAFCGSPGTWDRTRPYPPSRACHACRARSARPS